MTFVSNKGANTTLFHATGLGLDYWRFRSTGVFAATRYAGQGFSAGVVGSAAKGSVIGGISYEWLSITRYLSNQNDAPLTSLVTGRQDAFVAWKPSDTAALEVVVSHERRDGSENVIDCAAQECIETCSPWTCTAVTDCQRHCQPCCSSRMIMVLGRYCLPLHIPGIGRIPVPQVTHVFHLRGCHVRGSLQCS